MSTVQRSGYYAAHLDTGATAPAESPCVTIAHTHNAGALEGELRENRDQLAVGGGPRAAVEAAILEIDRILVMGSIENTAGEGFFQRMAKLQEQPNRAHVLEIYYLCLCLGFQGQYAVRGGEGLGPIVDQVAARLGAGGAGEAISPHGEPRERLRGFMRRETPLVGLSVAFFALAVVVFIALKIVLGWNVSGATGDMTKGSPASASPGSH